MVTTLEDTTTIELVLSEAPTGSPPAPPERPGPPTPEPAVPRSPKRGWRSIARRIEGVSLFVLPLAAYLVAGWILAFRYHTSMGDAQARVGNGYYMLFSRDPHLAAVGFVWQPLTSLSVLPILLLKGLWWPLSRDIFAGAIMSSLFMALGVHHARKAMAELGIATVPRLALTALLAFNPMIIFYGANGMSEALYLCCLIIATRYLMRWLDGSRVADLIIAGVGVALAYMTRNEAALAAAFAAFVVFGVSWLRAEEQGKRSKFMTASTDVVIFVAPFTACFVGWAATSWLIVGHPFEQLQGTYGTSSMSKFTVGLGGDAERQTPGHVLHDVLALAPILPTVVATSVAFIVRRRDYRTLAPMALLGGGLLASVMGAVAHKTGAFLRYYIAVIPLAILLAAALAARARKEPAVVVPSVEPTKAKAASSRLRRLVTPSKLWSATLAALAVALAVPALATSWATMHSNRYGWEEDNTLRPMWNAKAQALSTSEYQALRSVADYIDGLHLPNGSLLLDNSNQCVPSLIMMSRHPTQFIIPNDRDFQQKLSDPPRFNVRFLLAVPIGGLGGNDAINRADASVYADGGGIATFYKDLNQDKGCPAFKLFKVNAFSSQGNPTVNQ